MPILRILRLAATSPSRSAVRSRRPALEVLEDRAVPATFLVNDFGDEGAGSGNTGDLRFTLNQAAMTAEADTITFASSGTVGLFSTLTVPNGVTIQGLGTGQTRIERNTFFEVSDFRLFDVLAGSSVTLRDLTASGGFASAGGGVSNAGNLTLIATRFTGNTATGDGGAVFNSGTLTVENSTFDGNSAFSGGAIANALGTATITTSQFMGNSGSFSGGALRIDQGTVTITASTIANNTAPFSAGISNNNASLSLTNSTISGNSATGIGFQSSGGIGNYTFGNLGDSPVTLVNSTFSGNTTVDSNGADDLNAIGLSGAGIPSITLRNTILAGSNSTAQPNVIVAGGFITSLGNNLSTDGSGNLIAPGDLPNTDPQLGALANNGGPTLTHAIGFGSPALDAGASVAGLGNDQRGLPRLLRFAPDIGAYEADTLLTSFVLEILDPFGVPLTQVLPGQPFSLRITPVDALGRSFPRLPGATIAVTFSSSDPSAVLPGPFVFDPELSSGSFLVPGFALGAAGPQSIAAALIGDANVRGTANLTVLDPPAPPPSPNRPPELFLDGLGDGLTNIGVREDRIFTVADADGDPVLITIQFGDGTATQFVTTTGTFLFSHTYFEDASFEVLITADDGRGGIDVERFRVDVLLPGIDVSLRLDTVDPGETVSASVPLFGLLEEALLDENGQPIIGVLATLTRDPNSVGEGALIVADVPTPVALALGGLVAEGNLITAFEVRVINGGVGDRLTVTFRYLNDDSDLPTLLFYDKVTRSFLAPSPSLFVVDPVAQTITLVLDSRSFPTPMMLGGTVFTISVPGTVSGSTNSVLATTLISNTIQPALATSSPSSSSLRSANSAVGSSEVPRPASTLIAARPAVKGNVVQDENSSGAAVLQELPRDSSTLSVLPTVTIKPSTIELPEQPAPKSEAPPPDEEETLLDRQEALDALFSPAGEGPMLTMPDVAQIGDPTDEDGTTDIGGSVLGLAITSAIALRFPNRYARNRPKYPECKRRCG